MPGKRTAMRYRQLGSTGLTVSEIGFGAWGIGGDAYGPVDEDVAKRTLRAAWDAGITFFDTADVYGEGRSEHLIGEALRDVRDRVVIATKVGALPHRGFAMPQDFTAAHVRRAIEASLRRLRTDYVDLYQLHSPPLQALTEGTVPDAAPPADGDGQGRGYDPTPRPPSRRGEGASRGGFARSGNRSWGGEGPTPRASMYAGELLQCLEDLRREGQARAVGISARSPADALVAARDLGFRVVQVNFNLLDRRAVDGGLFAYAREHGVGIVNRTPLCFGFLSGAYAGGAAFAEHDHRRNWSPEQRERWAEAPRLFEALRSRRQCTMAQVALAFCLAHDAVSTVIAGMLHPREVAENVGVMDVEPLSAEELEQVREIYRSHSFFLGRPPSAPTGA